MQGELITLYVGTAVAETLISCHVQRCQHYYREN